MVVFIAKASLPSSYGMKKNQIYLNILCYLLVLSFKKFLRANYAVRKKFQRFRVMAHIPLSQQTAGSLRSDVTYCVDASLDHKKVFLIQS